MSKWISVKERLPEEKQRVIVRCERIGTSVGWILWGEWMTDIGPSAGKITHWMPLPDPPKEGFETDRGARKYTAGEIKELAKKAFEA